MRRSPASERRACRRFAPGWLGGAALLCLAVLAVAGCRQDMHNQPKYRPMRGSEFFADARSARPLVEGTVARGHLNDDELLYTGRIDGKAVDLFPFPVTPDTMARGRERYDVFCAPCHGRTGLGNGMIVRRGYRQPPSHVIDRLREAPAGYFFDVITNGFGAMPDYRAQIAVPDRWAIVAYMRALQLSAHATAADVPPADLAALERGVQK